MISSPCAKCHKKNISKELCADDCQLLHAVQEYQVSLEESFVFHAIDYAETGRFVLHSNEFI